MNTKKIVALLASVILAIACVFADAFTVKSVEGRPTKIVNGYENKRIKAGDTLADQDVIVTTNSNKDKVTFTDGNVIYQGRKGKLIQIINKKDVVEDETTTTTTSTN